MSNQTRVERTSERELVVTRLLDAPLRLVFEAWTTPELFVRWWLPAAFGITLISHDFDIRTGGSYRLVLGHAASEQPMTFFGRYLEVTAPERIVWTNEEDPENGSITTATFEQRGETTLVTVSDLYPSKEALDAAIETGSTGGWDEQLGQLEALLSDAQAG